MRANHNPSIKICLILASLALPHPALAESNNVWMARDRIHLNVGGFFPKFNSKIRVSNDQVGHGFPVKRSGRSDRRIGVQLKKL